MAGRDRPVGLRLNEIELAKVQRLAAAKGVSVSELVRSLLADAFSGRNAAPAGTVVDEAHTIRFERAEGE